MNERVRTVLSGAIVLIIVGIALAPLYIKERAMLFLAPSADKAFEYGLRHINTPERGIYDLEKAEYFFSETARMDNSYPFVHHQLARIDFLNGEYALALAHVNTEIALMTGEKRAAPFYLRGLIEGYMEDYEASVVDYRQYVALHSEGWEGRTDLAWALVKTKRFDEALAVLDEGLLHSPENAWLLSVRATVLYEMGRIDEALTTIRRASARVDNITEESWHAAYPGNDPAAAKTGIATLRSATKKNLELIEQKAAEQRQ